MKSGPAIPADATAADILKVAAEMFMSDDIDARRKAIDMAVRASIEAFYELGVTDSRLNPLWRLALALTCFSAFISATST